MEGGLEGGTEGHRKRRRGVPSIWKRLVLLSWGWIPPEDVQQASCDSTHTHTHTHRQADVSSITDRLNSTIQTLKVRWDHSYWNSPALINIQPLCSAAFCLFTTCRVEALTFMCVCAETTEHVCRTTCVLAVCEFITGVFKNESHCSVWFISIGVYESWLKSETNGQKYLTESVE